MPLVAPIRPAPPPLTVARCPCIVAVCSLPQPRPHLSVLTHPAHDGQAECREGHKVRARAGAWGADWRTPTLASQGPHTRCTAVFMCHKCSLIAYRQLGACAVGPGRLGRHRAMSAALPQARAWRRPWGSHKGAAFLARWQWWLCSVSAEVSECLGAPVTPSTAGGKPKQAGSTVKGCCH